MIKNEPKASQVKTTNKTYNCSLIKTAGLYATNIHFKITNSC